MCVVGGRGGVGELLPLCFVVHLEDPQVSPPNSFSFLGFVELVLVQLVHHFQASEFDHHMKYRGDPSLHAYLEEEWSGLNRGKTYKHK